MKLSLYQKQVLFCIAVMFIYALTSCAAPHSGGDSNVRFHQGMPKYKILRHSGCPMTQMYIGF